MRTDTIFLLYGGESEDGRGTGIYKGFTEDENEAYEFYKDKIQNNPYSTGRVVKITRDGRMEIL